MSTSTITIAPDQSGFAENKDSAKELRLTAILPALDRGDEVVLNFSSVGHATQSYVHALIGEALKKHGEPVLDRIQFQGCSPAIKGVIELVVDYSLGGFGSSSPSKLSLKRRTAEK